jgi:hypothetical protein
MPLATDPRQFRVVVRPRNGWRSYATFGLFGNPVNEALQAAVRDLEAIGSELAWKPDTGTAEPPDVPVMLSLSKHGPRSCPADASTSSA